MLDLILQPGPPFIEECALGCHLNGCRDRSNDKAILEDTTTCNRPAGGVNRGRLQPSAAHFTAKIYCTHESGEELYTCFVKLREMRLHVSCR